MIHRIRALSMFLLAAGCCALPAAAQTLPGLPGASSPGSSMSDSKDVTTSTGKEGKQESAPDETTPQGMLRLYLDATGKHDWGSAARYLDLSHVDEAATTAGPELARELKIVLDRTMWLEPAELSDQSQGDTDDGQRDLDRLGTIDTDRGSVDVMLARVPGEHGFRVWRFSSATVRRVPALYDRFGYGPLGDWLPAPFFEIVVFGVMLWQWIGIGATLMLSAGLSLLLVWVAYHVARPLARRTKTELDDRLLSALIGPARLLVFVGSFAAASLALQLPLRAQRLIGNVDSAAALFAVLWIALRLIDVVAELVGHRLDKQDRRAATAVLPLARRTTKVIAGMIVAITTLQVFGFNVTGMLAGLGLGGLAVALAAQRSLENMFSGVALIVDQPVRVGDFGRFGDWLGTVEDIGLRSTKVRTLDRTVVAIPNSQFAEMHLDNLSKRDRIRLHTVIGLRYETSGDQLRDVIIGIRRMLAAHPKISLEPLWRVRFRGFGDYSLDVEIFVYTETQNFGEFTAINEDVMFRIKKIVEDAGTGFAFPSQTTYLGRDSGLDEDAGRQAEKRVAELREKTALPFPDFAEATLDELRGTLDYPEPGAVRDAS